MLSDAEAISNISALVEVVMAAAQYDRIGPTVIERTQL
jgi:hypothetical protein